MSILAIVIASVAQFIIGAIWYMPIFGKKWGEIHGMDKVPPEELAMMQKKMGPFFLLQFAMTVLTTFVLSIFITYLPHDWNVYALAFFFWIGFVVPTQVSAVVFGGTQPEWIATKVSIMAGGSLVCLEVGAIILKMML